MGPSKWVKIEHGLETGHPGAERPQCMARPWLGSPVVLSAHDVLRAERGAGRHSSVSFLQF